MSDLDAEFIGISRNYIRILDGSSINSRMFTALSHHKYNVSRMPRYETSAKHYDVVYICKSQQSDLVLSDLIQTNPNLLIYIVDVAQDDFMSSYNEMVSGGGLSSQELFTWVDVIFDSAYVTYAQDRPLSKIDARLSTFKHVLMTTESA